MVAVLLFAVKPQLTPIASVDTLSLLNKYSRLGEKCNRFVYGIRSSYTKGTPSLARRGAVLQRGLSSCVCVQKYNQVCQETRENVTPPFAFVDKSYLQIFRGAASVAERIGK